MTDAPYDVASYGIWKSGQFPFEIMYSHSVRLSNSVVTGCKSKVVRFFRVQISDRFRRTRTLCFIIPLSQHGLWTAHKTSPSHQSLHHLLISLEPVLKVATAAGYATVYITTEIFIWVWSRDRFRTPRSCGCGEGTSGEFWVQGDFGCHAKSMENTALLFVWIATSTRLVLSQRHNMIPKLQSILYISKLDSFRKLESFICKNRFK